MVQLNPQIAFELAEQRVPHGDCVKRLAESNQTAARWLAMTLSESPLTHRLRFICSNSRAMTKQALVIMFSIVERAGVNWKPDASA